MILKYIIFLDIDICNPSALYPSGLVTNHKWYVYFTYRTFKVHIKFIKRKTASY